MSRAGNGDDLRRLSAEILGPHDHLEFHRFRWLRSAMGRLEYPWDALLVSTMAGGLYATALFGALVIVWWPGSMLAGILGIVTVGAAAVFASRLVVNRP